MRQLYYDNGLVVEEFPRPVAKKGHIVVQSKFSLMANGMNPSVRSAFPSLGFSGVIIEQQDTDLPVGERVAGIGLHGDYHLVSAQTVVVLPKQVTLEEAAFAAEGARALQAVRRLGAKLGDTVAVVGLGLIGQIACQLLKASGCSVIGIDDDESRVIFANKYWGVDCVSKKAPEFIAEKTQGAGTDAMLITEKDIPWDLCKENGSIVVMTEFVAETSPKKELIVRTCYKDDESLASVMGLFLELVAAGRVSLKPLMPQSFPFDKAKVAYAYLEKTSAFSVLIAYQDSSAETFFSTGKKVTGDIKTAVIGAGSYAQRVQLPLLKKFPLFALQSVVTQSGQNVKDVAVRFKIESYGTNYLDVLDQDLVFICTRSSLHGRITIDAAKRSKAIFCEQPMAVTEDELRAVVKAINSAGCLYVSGCNRRFSPLIEKIQDALKKTSGQTLINYRINKSVKNHPWLLERKEGGLILGDAGTHIDVLNAIVGVDPAEVVVRSSGEGNFVALIKYVDGSLANVFYRAHQDELESQETLEIFKNGTTVLLDDFKEVVINDTAFTLKNQNLGRNNIIEYLGSVLSGKESQSFGLRESAVATMTLLKLEDALRSGVPQRLDLDWIPQPIKS